MKTVVMPIHLNSVSFKDVRSAYIYILKGRTGLYKAHRVRNGFAFIELYGSECWANGSHSSLQALIENVLIYNSDGVVYEFEDLREFAVWIYNNT